MSLPPKHLRGITTHARRGNLRNAFRYGVDYVLIDPSSRIGPALFSRNRFNLASVYDRDHGGAVKVGRGVDWARQVFADRGVPLGAHGRILLLTQPRFLGYVFNPVSFWLAYDGAGALRAIIAEVNNPFDERHSYFCAAPDFAPIDKSHDIVADKLFYVSPFQDIAGQYRFQFDISSTRIAIRIAHENGDQGVIATLYGPLENLTNRGILWGFIRRPFGALRTIGLIYWQALKLRLKGARYRNRPQPPVQEVSECRS